MKTTIGVGLLLAMIATGAPGGAQTLPAWASFEQTWATVSAYSATVAVFEREGTQVQSSVLEYTFSKPSTATVRFVAGKNMGVTTIRASSIDQLSFAAFLTHAHATPGTLSEQPGPTILDIPTVAVTLVPASSALDNGVTREVVDISVPTNLPLRVLGYDHDMLIRQIDFSNVKVVAR
jgi:outer membrane lipoprotein-sorting protein